MMTETAETPLARQLSDLPHVMAYVSIVFTGAIFGFFYAWVCSTMWGLGNADPRVAIEAMQEMNASVRNAVFFPAFFLTPVVLGATSLIARQAGSDRSSKFFAAAAIVYAVGGMAVTGIVNVPMNENLATTVIPSSVDAAARIWDDYSGRWQIYNAARTLASGVSLVLAAIGLANLDRSRTRS